MEEHIISSRFSLNVLGITVKFVDGDKPSDFEKLIDSKTKAIIS